MGPGCCDHLDREQRVKAGLKCQPQHAHTPEKAAKNDCSAHDHHCVGVYLRLRRPRTEAASLKVPAVPWLPSLPCRLLSGEFLPEDGGARRRLRKKPSRCLLLQAVACELFARAAHFHFYCRRGAGSTAGSGCVASKLSHFSHGGTPNRSCPVHRLGSCSGSCCLTVFARRIVTTDCQRKAGRARSRPSARLPARPAEAATCDLALLREACFGASCCCVQGRCNEGSVGFVPEHACAALPPQLSSQVAGGSHITLPCRSRGRPASILVFPR